MKIKGYILLAALLAIVTTACERRELYVYGDEYHSVVLNVDWREYSTTDPDGMTVWFYALDDPTHAPYRTTTANVRRHELYLPGGRYQGIVVDYSPEEYSRQQFLGMEALETARVENRPAAYQPDSLTIVGEGVPAGTSAAINDQLYGEEAFTILQQQRPALSEATGYYVIADQPEKMGLDTLDNKIIESGEYGDYIPWKERNTYQSTLTLQELYAVPHGIIWQLRVRIHIPEGFNYLWQQVGSISGLADGHLLAQDVNTDGASLLSVSDWELQRSGANEGYIAATLTTFGLRPISILPDALTYPGTREGGGTAVDDALGTRAPGDTEPAYEPSADWWSYRTGICLPEAVRLNLSFVLRDHATTLHYHFDVGHLVVSYDNQHVLRIDLDTDIRLPYVEAYTSTGFAADVTPWDDQAPVEVNF